MVRLEQYVNRHRKPGTILLCLLGWCFSPAHAEDSVRRALAEVPSSLDSVLVIPVLEDTAETISDLLDAMNRSGTLLGTLPVDQVKTMLGFPLFVDDTGALILAWNSDIPAPGEAPGWCLVLSSRRPGQLVESNLWLIEGTGARRHVGGSLLFSRVTEKCVILSPRQSIITQPARGEAGARDWLAPWPDAVHTSDEIFVQGNVSMLPGILVDIIGSSDDAADPTDPKSMVQEQPVLEDIFLFLRGMRITIDFDPLALVVQGTCVIEPTVNPPPRPEGTSLSHLPRTDYLLAGTMNVARVQSFGAMGWLSGLIGVPELEDLDDVNRMQAAVYRPGDGAPLMSRSLAVLETYTTVPASMALWSLSQALAGRDTGGARLRPVQGDPLRMDREAPFEIRPSTASVPDADRSVLMHALLGTEALPGRFLAQPGIMALQLGQDAQLSQAAIQGSPDSLEDDPIVRTMRSWMPPGRDIELYVDLAGLREHLLGSPDMQSLPLFVQDIPLNGHPPPIGFAAGFEEDGTRMTLVIPAAVLTAAYDYLVSGGSTAKRPAN